MFYDHVGGHLTVPPFSLDRDIYMVERTVCSSKRQCYSVRSIVFLVGPPKSETRYPTNSDPATTGRRGHTAASGGQPLVVMADHTTGL